MSFLTKLFRGDPFDNPAVPMTSENVAFFTELFGGGRTDSNEIVTPATSLQCTAVWACVSLISEQAAMTPKHIYKLTGKGKELALDHPLYDLVHSQPNPEQSAVPFWVGAMMGLLLDGNAYIEIQRDNANRIIALWVRDPAKTTPVRFKDGLWFQTTDCADGKARLIDARDMVHIIGMTLNGWKGVSPITYARQTIGSHLAMDRFGARFFGNYATPSLAIEIAEPVDSKTKALMRQEWEQLQSGSNSHRVAILDQGMKVQPFSINPDDAQYLQTKQASDREIARLFHVPPHAIGDLDKGIKSNVEQQAIDLLNYCLKPWFVRVETALTGKLFSNIGRAAGKYVVKYDTRSMLSGDQAARQAYLVSMIQNGVLSINEAREMEGFNPIGPEGDEHYVQLNLQTAGQALLLDAVPNEADSTSDIIDEEEENSARLIGATLRGKRDRQIRLLTNFKRLLAPPSSVEGIRQDEA